MNNLRHLSQISVIHIVTNVSEKKKNIPTAINTNIKQHTSTGKNIKQTTTLHVQLTKIAIKTSNVSNNAV